MPHSTSRIDLLLNSPVVLALAIFGLALAARLPDLAVFVGPDEFTWLNRASDFTEALAARDFAGTFRSGHPGVTLMWTETVGAWVSYGLGLADWDSVLTADRTMTLLGNKRLVVAIANAGLLVGIVLLVRQVFDSPTAWLAGCLLAFDPFFLTESRALRPEALVAGFSTLTLLGMLFYLKNPRNQVVILIGILTGLSLLSKISAAALAPVGLCVLMGVALTNTDLDTRQRWLKGLIAIIIWGAVTLATIVVLWPALWVAPVEVYHQLYEYSFTRVVEGDGGGKSFFMGQIYPDEAPGVLFYPVVLVFRTSPLMWLGLALLVVLILTGSRVLSRQFRLALGIMLLYLLAYLVLIVPSELKFDRYTVPMLPTLTIMAGVGLAAGWRRLGQGVPAIAGSTWLMIFLVLTGQATLAWLFHPYYYTYWNPLVGGSRQAAQVLPVGIGGEGLDQMAHYVNTLPDADRISIASANSQKIEPIVRGQTIALDNLDGKWVQADYTMIYISQLQRGKHAEDIIDYLGRQAPVYTLTLHGLEYAWLYPGPAAGYYGGGHKLEGRGTLFGYDLPATEATAGDSLAVTLYWRNEGQRPDDRFFVRVMDVDGYVWAEAIAQPRSGFEEANRTENSIVESEAVLKLPIGMPPGDYFIKPGFRTSSGEVIGYFRLPDDTGPIRVQAANTYPEPASFQPPHPAPVPVNSDLTLQGYALEPPAALSGSSIWLTLYWQALADVNHDYVILIRLLDPRQTELAYWLGRPVRSGYPTTRWRAGQIVQDPWLLSLPAEIGAGKYQIEVAVFDAGSELELARQVITQIAITE